MSSEREVLTLTDPNFNPALLAFLWSINYSMVA
ncbi:hypothetical protein MCEMIH15_02662 [Caulobacteraceae bacterium]